jgi:hypothetical protein
MGLRMSLGPPHDQVVHPRWSEHHRPTTSSTLTADCDVTRQDGHGVTGPAGVFTPSAATVVYTGPCRIQALTSRSARPVVVGEAQETRHRYQVSLLWDAAQVQIGDLVTVTGKRLRVTDIQYGSEQWQRDLACDQLED